MRSVPRALVTFVVIPVVTAVGCESPTAAPPPATAGSRLSAAGANGVVLNSTGGGHYFLQNAFDVQFAYTAKQRADGTVQGEFHESLLLDGETVAFRGDVTCMAVHPVNHLACLGAVTTENMSTRPAFQEWYHQVGEDVGVRVVDYGEGSEALPDRKIFMGFENTPGIPTSEVYCQLLSWPADDARTWAVTEGNIQVLR